MCVYDDDDQTSYLELRSKLANAKESLENAKLEFSHPNRRIVEKWGGAVPPEAKSPNFLG